MARHGVALLKYVSVRRSGHPQTLAEFARVKLNPLPHGRVREAPWRHFQNQEVGVVSTAAA